MPSEQLSAEALQWAMLRFANVGDNDLLPQSFEIEACAALKDKVVSHLSQIDLKEYRTRPIRRFMAPKLSGAYRSVVQLGPLDALVYRAFSYDAAELIEKHRPTVDAMKVFSFRVGLANDGRLFNDSVNYSSFHRAVLQAASLPEYKYMAEVDLADFYNQLSLHRVCNALELAGINGRRPRDIECFLTGITGGHSRGIPVGYETSTLLSEAALVDLDQFLLRSGIAYCRYVDDIRIFAETSMDITRAVHDLCEYLNTAHRLNVQESKTRFSTTQQFLISTKAEVEPEEKLAGAKIEGSIRAMFASLNSYDSSNFHDEAYELQTLGELFSEAMKPKPVLAGPIKYVLGYATRKRSLSILEATLTEMSRLLPVLPSLVRYFLAVPNKEQSRVADATLEMLTNSNSSFLPYVREWLLHGLITKAPPSYRDRVFQAAEATSIRLAALAALRFKYIDWVRSKKDLWSSYGPWDRRGLLYAASILPSDERKKWLSRIKPGSDFLDQVVIEWVLAK